MNNAIVNINDKRLIESQGNKLLNSNPFFQKLTYIMNDNVFRTFYNEYCSDNGDMMITMSYIKLYIEIEKIYYKKYGECITPSIMTKLLHDIFMDADLRKSILVKYGVIK